MVLSMYFSNLAAFKVLWKYTNTADTCITSSTTVNHSHTRTHSASSSIIHNINTVTKSSQQLSLGYYKISRFYNRVASSTIQGWNKLGQQLIIKSSQKPTILAFVLSTKTNTQTLYALFISEYIYIDIPLLWYRYTKFSFHWLHQLQSSETFESRPFHHESHLAIVVHNWKIIQKL